MNVVIIEDEKLSADHIATLLKKVDTSIQVIAVIDSVKKSIEEFRKGLSADLLLVDIHLADGLSFDIFAQHPIDTPVIFTTAYDEYAIKAFKLNSVDYLLKPIALSELQAAVDKFKKHRQLPDVTFFSEFAKAYQSSGKHYKNRFLVKMGETISSIKAEEIAYFTAEDGIVLLVTTGKKRYPVDYTLDELETLLSPENFFRINRKVTIHIHSIPKVSTYFNGRLKIASETLDDESCIVSRERVNDFKEWLGH